MPALLRRAALFLALVLTFVAAGCGGQKSADDSGPTESAVSEDVPTDAIALVGQEKVVKSEFDRLLEQAKKSYKTQKRDFPAPGTTDYETLKNQAVQYLVQRVQFRQEAGSRGIEIADGEVDKRLEELKKQYFGGDEKKFATQLEQQGLTEEQVLADVRAQLLSEKIYESVTKGVKVTDADVDAHYKANQDQYKQPATRDVRHILVKKKEKAEEIYGELEGGGDFAALAKRFSQDPGSKDQGGKLTIRRGETVPPFDKKAFELETGELGEPVKTDFGWHVIEALSDVKPEVATPLEEVRESIREQLLQAKRSAAMTKWVAELETKYDPRTTYAVGYEPPPEAATGTGAGTTGAETNGGTGEPPAGSTDAE